MKKKIESKKAPKALGPYSQAISFDQLIFVSGQLPIDPQTGKLIEGSITDLTRLILKNIQVILEEANSSLENILRTEVFLKDLKNFQEMNAEYARHFQGETPPARQTIQVADLPFGAALEISCIAYKK